MNQEIQQVDLEKEILPVPEQAKQITITDNESYERAAGILKSIKTLRNRIAEAFDPIIKKANEAVKEARASKERYEKPLSDAEAHIKPLMAKYLTEKEKQRKIEEAHKRAEAQAQAEEKRIQQAIKLEQSGNIAAAERALDAPVVSPPVVEKSTAPKVAGVSMRDNWKARIVDEQLIPREFLMPNMVQINQYAKAMKKDGVIPGVEIYNEPIISSGRSDA